jgi:carboxymethylenebutenolidase
MRLALVSRTATEDRVVDEMIVSFTHDAHIPWVLPGVAPTGRAGHDAVLAVIRLRGGLVDTEHIYWDQASGPSRTMRPPATARTTTPIRKAATPAQVQVIR